MPIVEMPRNSRKARAIALRADDRFLHRSGITDEPQERSLGLLVGTAIVAGFVFGLLFYEGGRSFATGAMPEQGLIIHVDPAPAGN